jgi:hypothetical protein
MAAAEAKSGKAAGGDEAKRLAPILLALAKMVGDAKAEAKVMAPANDSTHTQAIRVGNTTIRRAEPHGAGIPLVPKEAPYTMANVACRDFGVRSFVASDSKTPTQVRASLESAFRSARVSTCDRNIDGVEVERYIGFVEPNHWNEADRSDPSGGGSSLLFNQVVGPAATACKFRVFASHPEWQCVLAGTPEIACAMNGSARGQNVLLFHLSGTTCGATVVRLPATLMFTSINAHGTGMTARVDSVLAARLRAADPSIGESEALAAVAQTRTGRGPRRSAAESAEVERALRDAFTGSWLPIIASALGDASEVAGETISPLDIHSVVCTGGGCLTPAIPKMITAAFPYAVVHADSPQWRSVTGAALLARDRIQALESQAARDRAPAPARPAAAATTR